jgi:hypothetical protein
MAPRNRLLHSNVPIFNEIVIKSIFSKLCLIYFQGCSISPSYSMFLPQSNITNLRMQNYKFDQFLENEDTEENAGSFCRVDIIGHSKTRLVNYFIRWTIKLTNIGVYRRKVTCAQFFSSGLRVYTLYEVKGSLKLYETKRSPKCSLITGYFKLKTVRLNVYNKHAVMQS